MIKTDSSNGQSVKEIRRKQREENEAKLRLECETIARGAFTEDQVKKWSNENKGLWYLPVKDGDDEKMETFAIMKPINRHILSYASTKLSEGGLYEFLEQCMRDCFIASVEPDGTAISKVDENTKVNILDEDDYFIPAAMAFNKILEGKKASLLKR